MSLSDARFRLAVERDTGSALVILTEPTRNLRWLGLKRS